MKLEDVPIEKHFTVEFIAGICHALSDKTGEVYMHIEARDGHPHAELRRIKVDATVPSFLRKQAE